jgi:hypothetical protein
MSRLWRCMLCCWHQTMWLAYHSTVELIEILLTTIVEFQTDNSLELPLCVLFINLILTSNRPLPPIDRWTEFRHQHCLPSGSLNQVMFALCTWGWSKQLSWENYDKSNLTFAYPLTGALCSVHLSTRLNLPAHCHDPGVTKQDLWLQRHAKIFHGVDENLHRRVTCVPRYLGSPLFVSVQMWSLLQLIDKCAAETMLWKAKNVEQQLCYADTHCWSVVTTSSSAWCVCLFLLFILTLWLLERGGCFAGQSFSPYWLLLVLALYWRHHDIIRRHVHTFFFETRSTCIYLAQIFMQVTLCTFTSGGFPFAKCSRMFLILHVRQIY